MKKYAILIAGLLALMLAAGLALGKTRVSPIVAPPKLEAGETGIVTRVIDGDSFVLNSGIKVELLTIQAPHSSWPEKEIKGEPLTEDAKAFLSELILGKSVGLYYSGDKTDRYGRTMAQVWTLTETGDKDIWIQQAMVASGYARVYPWQEHAVETDTLYRAEEEARKNRMGIWNNRRTKSYYKVRNPEPNALAQAVDSVQIVEGVIVSAEDVKGTLYLNFGADYKTDFTIGISKSSRPSFIRAGIDPFTLAGARVRVRGWIEIQNGPIIWVSHPDRIEIIE